MSDDVLRAARRCMLAFAGERGPLVTPMAFWSDGASLWMATSASSVKAQLAQKAGYPGGVDTLAHETACAVYIPPVAEDIPVAEDAPVSTVRATGAHGFARGLVIHGSARIYTVDDPVGLALHWPVISTAMAALAVKNAASLTGYALDFPRTPLRWLPTNRVAIRVRMERVRPVAPPVPGPGIAPALPGVVPSDIRRVLAGQRQVALATGEGEDVTVQPAVLGAGFALEVEDPSSIMPGMPAVVAMDADPADRPAHVMGLALHGLIAQGPTLAAERATWWHGFDISGARIPERPAAGVVLPD